MRPGLGEMAHAGNPAGKRWLPLESNPQVLNQFSRSIGSTSKFDFHDVFGTDPDLLAFIPTPVVAVMLLFPITEASEAARAEQISKIQASGQTVSDKLWFCKQTIGNACGTMGVLHALCNACAGGSIELSGWIKGFFERTKGMDPDAKAAALEQDTDLDKIHEHAAQQGQTRPPELDETVLLHFICFVQSDGSMYELDGRKPFPINCGPSSPSSLLQDAVDTIKTKYLAVDPQNINFTMMALAPSLSSD